jgi:hypothetical protein
VVLFLLFSLLNFENIHILHQNKTKQNINAERLIKMKEDSERDRKKKLTTVQVSMHSTSGSELK